MLNGILGIGNWDIKVLRVRSRVCKRNRGKVSGVRRDYDKEDEVGYVGIK